MRDGAPRQGMDHDHYRWSPIISRVPLIWPDAARVALCVIVNLEYFEVDPPADSVQARDMVGGLGQRPYPQLPRLSHREYGHRVGIFRVLDALERRAIPATIAMDAMTAEEYPFLVEYCLRRHAEIVAHGVSVTRIISNRMGEDEERSYIAETLSRLRGATGVTSTGWLSPECSESVRTPRLLAQAGVSYVCDWANDDQPYPMTIPGASLHALPIALDLDDSYALLKRGASLNSYRLMLTRAFDQLSLEGEKTGRALVLNLHPWIIGQPFRIGVFEEFLDRVLATDHVWAATGSEIIDWYIKKVPL